MNISLGRVGIFTAWPFLCFICAKWRKIAQVLLHVISYDGSIVHILFLVTKCMSHWFCTLFDVTDCLSRVIHVLSRLLRVVVMRGGWAMWRRDYGPVVCVPWFVLKLPAQFASLTINWKLWIYIPSPFFFQNFKQILSFLKCNVFFFLQKRT